MSNANTCGNDVLKAGVWASSTELKKTVWDKNKIELDTGLEGQR